MQAILNIGGKLKQNKPQNKQTNHQPVIPKCLKIWSLNSLEVIISLLNLLYPPGSCRFPRHCPRISTQLPSFFQDKRTKTDLIRELQTSFKTARLQKSNKSHSYLSRVSHSLSTSFQWDCNGQTLE